MATPNKVQQIVKMLEQDSKWDTINVIEHSPRFWVIDAERDGDNLLRTNLSAYVSTRQSERGRFCGGYRRSVFGKERKIRTWQDLRIWGGI